MSVDAILTELDLIKKEALGVIAGALDLKVLDESRVLYLGKKGKLTQVLKGLGSLSSEDRPKVGSYANQLRDEIQAAISHQFNQLESSLLSEKLSNEKVDVTLPGRLSVQGSVHPIHLMMDEISRIFHGIGFEIADGPEVETDFYNFEALNMPADHPARDSQDTFFMGKGRVMRTQTSSVQIRVMKEAKPPIRIICPGAVYRSDHDATHSPMFHQIEGLWVDKGIQFSDLKGVLQHFLNEVFGGNIEMRLRPSFFPFTEPSAEVDMKWGKDKWLEILGCGMVDPEVFKAVGIDPDEYTGFAFGIGIERMAMLKYNIPDLRLFFENDVRFLKQFQR